MPALSDLPKSIRHRQPLSSFYRQQFPADLVKHITAHRAQGQSLIGLVSVDMNLDSADGSSIPPDIGSLLYVALTRARLLKYLLVSAIPLRVWSQIGSSDLDKRRRVAEEALVTAARKFACDHHFEPKFITNLHFSHRRKAI